MKNRETDEWLAQNQKSTREFIRKWGHFCKHDQYLKPIVPPKYDIGFIINNGNLQLLEALEPWCSTIYIKQPGIGSDDWVWNYVQDEGKKTSFDLRNKVLPYDNKKQNEILIEIDGNIFNQQDFQIINQLPEILQDSGEVGEFELGNLKITVNNLTTYEKELICNITS